MEPQRPFGPLASASAGHPSVLGLEERDHLTADEDPPQVG